MNRKEIFEKVKAHLLTQGERSTGRAGCQYRGSYGRKCAIGVLITDECYERSLEGRSTSSPTVIEALECSGLKIEEDDGYFLRDLQGIHDNNPPDQWPKALAQLAKNYKL